jgi:hypothetical protein
LKRPTHFTISQGAFQKRFNPEYAQRQRGTPMEDVDVTASAKLLMTIHADPADAMNAALEHAQEHMDREDLKGAAYWGRVAALISASASKPPR